MPLSEALAARRHATRPWWRKLTDTLTDRVPATLHGRWGLGARAVIALACLSILGAAVGGWYLSRSEGTVVLLPGGADGGGGGGGGGKEAETAAAADASATAGSNPGAPPGAAASSGGGVRPGGTAGASAGAGTTGGVGAAGPGVDAGGAAGSACDARSGRLSGGERGRTWGVDSAGGGRVGPASWGGGSASGVVARGWDGGSLTGAAWSLFGMSNGNARSLGELRTPAVLTPPCPAHQPTNSSATIVVDVEGKVAHPGIQALPSGARVYEALKAAGDLLPGADATGLDLARPLLDGEQLRVGLPGAPSPPAGLQAPSVGPRGKRGRSAEPVNLNTATLEQLESIPDVGPALAQRILDWRERNGSFASVAQLRQVRGIGERKFADMQDSVTV